MAASRLLFDGVWKGFRRGERHDSLRDLIPDLVRRFARRSQVPARANFWALRDVSFEVRPGEALGIIGANGAGKSTVLKLLNRIMAPTRGRIEVQGRVGALIEVASGFHGDLTGRENIYLQGAIMGMKRADIARQFDEIVAFSGVGDFIDTPVKRYSSGMNARLGFAVAAHLDPDVLLIDEVLSVGDFAFQQKAFERLREIVNRDIPVVVVSHQLDRITSLCSQALLLGRGEVVRQGSPADCIAAYVMNQAASASPEPGCPVVLARVHLAAAGPVRSGGWATLVVAGAVGSGSDAAVVTIRIRSSQTGQVLFATSNARCEVDLPRHGEFALETDLQMNVPEGVYFAETLVRDQARQRLLAHGPYVCIEVREGPGFNGSVQLNPSMRLVTPRTRERSAI